LTNNTLNIVLDDKKISDTLMIFIISPASLLPTTCPPIIPPLSLMAISFTDNFETSGIVTVKK